MMANIIDPKYEYDAPVYVDFTALAVDQVPDDDADKWFDNRLEDDLLFDNSFNPVGAASKVPIEPPSHQPAAICDNTAPSNDSATQEGQGVSIKAEPTSPVSVEVQKELQDVPVKTEPAVPVCAEDGNEAKTSTDIAAPDTKEGSEVGTVKLGKRSAGEHARAAVFMEGFAKMNQEDVEPSVPNKAAKVGPPEKAPKPKKERRLASQKASSNIHHILKKARTPRRAAVLPSTSEPKHSQPPKKTTEELELEEVKRLQKEAKKALQQSRRSFQRLGKSPGLVVVKGSKPTTQAREFNFHTKDRERSRPGSATKKEGINPTNFPQTLRNFNSTDNYNPNFAVKKPPTPELKTRPFKFCLDERFKSKSNASSSEIIPTAEAIEKYQKATPPRFRSNSGSVTKKWKVKVNASDQSSSSSNSDDTGGPHATKLTVPNTPNLLTKGRSRPVTAKSAAEVEEEVVAQMKEYQFKAKPLNPDIFLKGGLHGVPRKKTEVELTEAHTPPLATTERCRKRKAHEMTDATDEDKEEQTATTFHAQPMPNFNKITGLPAKKKMPITEPESPALALKRRRLHNSQTEEGQKGEEAESHVIRANPMPNMDKYFQPQLPHKCVETQPFTFEERDKNKPTKETFVEMILRKEKAQKAPFKAQPLPDFGLLPDLPPKAPPHNIKLKPFSLHTEMRGEQHTIKHQEKLEDEVKKMKEQAEFKANPASVLQKEPFMPQIPIRPLLTVDNFVLHSEVRSEQRAKYDAKRVREEYERMTENLQRRALRAAEESKEIADYRKKLVHKAQPIHQYAPVIIKPGDRPITVPKSPYFRTDDRLRVRHME